MPIEYLENISLAPLTTFGVGGKARYFVEARSEADIEAVFSENRPEEIFVLGGGSNVLISDAGFDGVVLKIATEGIEIEERTSETTRITTKAGEDWDEFVGFCVSRGLAGVECLSGIPGLVGSTPIQNVGAYGQEVSETIVSVKVLERATGSVSHIDRAGCGFEYRTSIFNSTQKDRYVVLEVTYDLKNGGAPKIAYADLNQRFEGQTPDLETVREGVRQIRASKGMLVRQGGPDSRSAGSFFKNPIVDASKIMEISETLEVEEEKVPRYKVSEKGFKVPAAWLIERAGFKKGFRLGYAGISNLHSLALINCGGATADEIIALKEEIEARIESKFDIRLINEPNLIGFRD